MNRFIMGIVLLLISCGVAAAAGTVESPKSCQNCGMDRVAYAHSRMVVVYADGTRDGVCSLNCVVEQMKKHKHKKVKSLKVADYATKEMVDARTAAWVVGGNKPGVMTTVPKWAFATKEGANTFIKENGGRLTTFDEALNMAMKENK